MGEGRLLRRRRRGRSSVHWRWLPPPEPPPLQTQRSLQGKSEEGRDSRAEPPGGLRGDTGQRGPEVPGGGGSYPKSHSHHPASGQQGPAAPRQLPGRRLTPACPSAIRGLGGGHIGGSRPGLRAVLSSWEVRLCQPRGLAPGQRASVLLGFGPHKGTARRVTFLCPPVAGVSQGRMCIRSPSPAVALSVVTSLLRCHRRVTCWWQFACGLSVPTRRFAEVTEPVAGISEDSPSRQPHFQKDVGQRAPAVRMGAAKAPLLHLCPRLRPCLWSVTPGPPSPAPSLSLCVSARV